MLRLLAALSAAVSRVGVRFATPPPQHHLTFRMADLQAFSSVSGGPFKMSIVKTGETTLPLRLGGVHFPVLSDIAFVLDIVGGDQIAHDFSVLVVGQDLSPPTSPTASLH